MELDPGFTWGGFFAHALVESIGVLAAFGAAYLAFQLARRHQESARVKVSCRVGENRRIVVVIETVGGQAVLIESVRLRFDTSQRLCWLSEGTRRHLVPPDHEPMMIDLPIPEFVRYRTLPPDMVTPIIYSWDVFRGELDRRATEMRPNYPIAAQRFTLNVNDVAGRYWKSKSMDVATFPGDCHQTPAFLRGLWIIGGDLDRFVRRFFPKILEWCPDCR